jgi:predicted tellurium resistance membrane protein TerC
MDLRSDLFNVGKIGISGRDLILLLGGLFLMHKSVKEIHKKATNTPESQKNLKQKISFSGTIVQIVLFDLVFSLDSVITAVGMVDEIQVMIAAVIVAMIVMFLSAKSISAFVNNNPAIKILALAFLIMIGVALVAEGLDFHIPKGYIYFSMAFAFSVELINIHLGNRKKNVVLEN